MTPDKKIKIPAVAMERVAEFRAQVKAADEAVNAFMGTAVVDWQGKPSTLLEITQSIGNADAIRHAARDMFMALTSQGIGYREYQSLMRTQSGIAQITDETKNAIRHFSFVIRDSNDLKSMGLGDGELLMLPFDWHIRRFNESHPKKSARRLVS
jgi:uncharacterized protein (DUF2461 family)